MCFDKTVTSELPGFFSSFCRKYFMYSSYADIFENMWKKEELGTDVLSSVLNSGNGSAAWSSVLVEDQRLMRCSRKGMEKCVGKYFVVVRLMVYLHLEHSLDFVFFKKML